MKKLLWLIVILFVISLCTAELYDHKNLDLALDVDGEFELIKENPSSVLNSATATLNLYPEDDYRQMLLDLQTAGEVQDGKIVFEWGEGGFGINTYGFDAELRTENRRREIVSKIAFPITDASGFEQYLEATESIDKDHPDIINKASELAEGEDDLFVVVFNLLSWIEQNIEYDLNTLTADASQKASWVLQNRQGVCDEMTSLFIAMCRSLGIPARFVSGISYTTSDLFTENWLPHGWAEVYFPGQGWVDFDPAFGEYGYVDVTHIKLRDGFDPTEPSTKFEWLAEEVSLEGKGLDFTVVVQDKGKLTEDEISIQTEIVGEEVNLGSYNLIKGIIISSKDYYLATRLKLAVPPEVKIINQDTKTVLLKPNQEKTVYWMVKVDELPRQYRYEFPAVVYSEKNVSSERSFFAVIGGIDYTEPELQKLMIEDDEKNYSQQISLYCDYQNNILLGEEGEITCKVKNEGNTNLKNLRFCVADICRELDLPINQGENLSIKVKGEAAGWEKIVVKAENQQVVRTEVINYAVLDQAEMSLKVKAPEEAGYGQKFNITLTAVKESFASPKNILIAMQRRTVKNTWEISELKDKKDLVIEMDSSSLGSKNSFKISYQWKDYEGNVHEKEDEVMVRVSGNTVWEKIILFFQNFI